ncbi:complexin-1 isoform X2 [Haliaeetus albicilla]|uniref:complexin-1 isoform X2 n=1 Tax=Haliaeetus albicilla TaxID=8969 RepID=UPI0037E701C6
MDFVMKQALGGATKDMGKMLGGDEEKDPDAAKKEEERQEALRQEEEERKAKYAKMEAEREVMRQGIRDKVTQKAGKKCRCIAKCQSRRLFSFQLLRRIELTQIFLIEAASWILGERLTKGPTRLRTTICTVLILRPVVMNYCGNFTQSSSYANSKHWTDVMLLPIKS